MVSKIENKSIYSPIYTMQTDIQPIYQPIHIGIIGGGQLGRMLIEATPTALQGTVHYTVIDPDPHACSHQAIYENKRIITASINPIDKDTQAILERCNCITFEIESIDTAALQSLNVPTYPQPIYLKQIQNKYDQLAFLASWGLPVPKFSRNLSDMLTTGESSEIVTDCLGGDRPHRQISLSTERDMNWPLIIKLDTGGYDGRGVFIVHNKYHHDQITGELQRAGKSWFYQRWLQFECEVAQIVFSNGTDIETYPVVDTVQTADTTPGKSAHNTGALHICESVVFPSRFPDSIQEKITRLSKSVMRTFPEYRGLLAVEYFVCKKRLSGLSGSTGDDEYQVWINELAPRPHNSGHYTLSACNHSQFETHLRCILGMPITAYHTGNDLDACKKLSKSCSDKDLYHVYPVTTACTMINIIAGSSDFPDPETTQKRLDAYKADGADVYWYGKEWRMGRKMGHVNITP